MSKTATYTIIGATGNIGGRIAAKLLQAGQRVRVPVRDSHKAAALARQGAELLVGNLEDVDFVTSALTGADAAFLMIPPLHGADDLRAWQNKIGKIQVEALVRAGVRRVVHLSSVGAQYPNGTGPIAGLYDQEQRLNKLEGVQVVHLRPTFFLENLHNTTHQLADGFLGGQLEPEVKLPMIATADIADVAVAELQSEFSGIRIRELLGADAYSMRDVAAAVGRALGREIGVVHFAPEDARKALPTMGISPSVTEALIEMFGALNAGRIEMGPRTAENTTPTRLQDFLPALLPATSQVG